VILDTLLTPSMSVMRASLSHQAPALSVLWQTGDVTTLLAHACSVLNTVLLVVMRTHVPTVMRDIM